MTCRIPSTGPWQFSLQGLPQAPAPSRLSRCLFARVNTLVAVCHTAPGVIFVTAGFQQLRRVDVTGDSGQARQLLCACAPWLGPPWPVTAAQVLAGKLPELQGEGVPDEVCALYRECCATDPKAR